MVKITDFEDFEHYVISMRLKKIIERLIAYDIEKGLNFIQISALEAHWQLITASWQGIGAGY